MKLLTTSARIFVTIAVFSALQAKADEVAPVSSTEVAKNEVAILASKIMDIYKFKLGNQTIKIVSLDDGRVNGDGNSTTVVLVGSEVTDATYDSAFIITPSDKYISLESAHLATTGAKAGDAIRLILRGAYGKKVTRLLSYDKNSKTLTVE